jgi:NADH:ubiquinone oxidoreductase subunit F (NADH-binding)
MSRAATPTSDHRLLAAWADTGRPDSYDAHLARHGNLPAPGGRAARERLIADVTRSGLGGRGGAGFPTGRKLAAVAAGRGRKVVVANGCESDPGTHKDRVLAQHSPHLILDGALVAAAALHTSDVYVCAHRDGATYQALAQALAQRPDADRFTLADIPSRFVASEESSLANFLSGGEARPTSKPPRVFERGVAGRPTFVSNVETLAHVALIARYGPDWFRTLGTDFSPGTALVSMGGAVRTPGVLEVAYGTALPDLVASVGGATEPLQALLIGGYSGCWVPDSVARTLHFSHEELRAAGTTVGVGSVLALPAGACGIAETARILSYLAGESASQCGPCMFGLPAITADFGGLASGAGARDKTLAPRLARRLSVISGRGACGHPDGAVRLAESALRTFAVDVDAHLHGRPCRGAGALPFLPIPRRTLSLVG